MKTLVNTFYNLELKLIENEITVLSVESPSAYQKIMHDLWQQYNGSEGSFILSENGKELKIQKNVECIYNPFAVNLNDKKILTKLYQELSLQGDALLQEDGIELRGSIIRYFDRLLNTVPYDITYNFEFELSSIITALDVQTDSTTDTLTEKLCSYMNLLQQLCGISIFVISNLKCLLLNTDLQLLYESAKYNKINLIIIEPIHTPHIKDEKCWIIDKDLCIIEA